jgi:hypothetical protein
MWVIAFNRAQKKIGNEIENMILNMIQDFSLVEEEELLTA